MFFIRFRIHLRQGTPAIQKLWGAALIIGTMTTQIRDLALNVHHIFL